jgi:CRP-like cAMP-binding protein
MFNRKITDEIEFKTLSSCPLFAGLSKGELKTVLNISHIRDYSSDEKVFTEGTIGLCFYIVVKGKVDIVTETPEEGTHPKTIKTYKAGAYFSEAHLFAEINHTVSCIAREVTKLIIFTKPDFDDFVKINPKTGNKLLLNFLRFTSIQLEQLYKQNMELLQQKNPETI